MLRLDEISAGNISAGFLVVQFVPGDLLGEMLAASPAPTLSLESFLTVVSINSFSDISAVPSSGSLQHKTSTWRTREWAT
jgi:hypothetical protein